MCVCLYVCIINSKFEFNIFDVFGWNNKIWTTSCDRPTCGCWCSVTQLYLTLCDPVDCSPPGFSVHGIFQARILEWGAVPSPIYIACMLSCFSYAWLCASLWTVACQAPLSIGFSSKSTRLGCHALLQGFFPTQGLSQGSCTVGRFFTTEPPGKPIGLQSKHQKNQVIFKNYSLFSHLLTALFYQRIILIQKTH